MGVKKYKSPHPTPSPEMGEGKNISSPSLYGRGLGGGSCTDIYIPKKK